MYPDGSMRIEPIRDRERIERFLRHEEAAHVYAIADLEEPFWSDGRWLAGLDEDGAMVALCLVLRGLRLPILYAVCAPDHEPTRALLRGVRSELPDRLFYNLGPGHASELAGFGLAPEGRYWKMVLRDRRACEEVSGDGVLPLGPEDHEELARFLAEDAYLPDEVGGLFFERQMLDGGCYRAIREKGRLLAVGGVHVHSPRYGVSAIGNVVTRPEARGRGLARRISAAIVRALRDAIPTVGLNVHEANQPALRCYQRLGFERVLAYEEGVATRRDRAS